MFILLVLLLFGVGFAIQILRFVAIVFFVLWLIGLMLGRGSSGRHRG